MSEYYCPTCGSSDVDSYEFVDKSKKVPERVHIYCNESDCGWIHRSLIRGMSDGDESEVAES